MYERTRKNISSNHRYRYEVHPTGGEIEENCQKNVSFRVVCSFVVVKLAKIRQLKPYQALSGL